jgi:hypothetical protein
MLDALRRWAAIQQSVWTRQGLHVQVTTGGVSINPGMRLDFDTPQCVGRITCWQSGECDLEVLEVDTEKLLYRDHQTLIMPADFDAAFHDFLRVLGGPA